MTNFNGNPNFCKTFLDVGFGLAYRPYYRLRRLVGHDDIYSYLHNSCRVA